MRSSPGSLVSIHPCVRTEKTAGLNPLWRAVIEVAFIVFLFYSNLLMGEFTVTNGPWEEFGVRLERYLYGYEFSYCRDLLADWVCCV